jgi:hypothetical protein
MDPKAWRIEQKLSLAAIAAKVGLSGKNPAVTYRRWEVGASRCPDSIVVQMERLTCGSHPAAGLSYSSSRGVTAAGDDAHLGEALAHQESWASPPSSSDSEVPCASADTSDREAA